ncbi:phage tail assembly protein [Jeotgalibacillus terrae]|uniref:Phage tail assembly protein n=1 Tax=Jeotgalibacillus terrae TaxID=587735 RepID=A0ABW5ZG03_9BACL|nr:phage tail assembly protein [Jeotgalibacillus terrae]MBM7580007.1 hypothetical protein [Jeotgalibacillus terrae]
MAKATESVKQDKKEVVVFAKPYQYEGKEYVEVDLSGVNNLTGDDLLNTEQKFNELGSISPMPQVTLPYTLLIAAEVTDLPFEFFKGLPAKEALKIRTMVMVFLNN